MSAARAAMEPEPDSVPDAVQLLRLELAELAASTTAHIHKREAVNRAWQRTGVLLRYLERRASETAR